MGEIMGDRSLGTLLSERLPRIVGAYAAGCIAAGLAFALEDAAFVHLWIQSSSSLPGSLGELVLSMSALASFYGGMYALVPALVMIAVGEARSLRAPAYYVATTVVAALIAWVILVFLPVEGRRLFPDENNLALAFGVAGLAFGHVYWRLAGRTAGRVPMGAVGT
jgi:hypothetical protein